MKKMFMISSLALWAGLALAESTTVSSCNTYGVMRVTSELQRTFVAIPWVKSATTATPITVDQFITTQNLDEGDRVHVLYKNDEGQLCYHSWILGDGKQWQQMKEVADIYGRSLWGESPAAIEQTLERGAAVLLMRNNPTSDGKAKPFYLCGQAVATTGSSTPVAGTATTPVVSLIAPTSDYQVGLNDLGVMFGEPNADDRIQIPVADGMESTLSWCAPTAVYNETAGKWEKSSGGTAQWCLYNQVKVGSRYGYYWVPAGKLPVGQGFWYISKGGSPTFTWPNQSAENQD